MARATFNAEYRQYIRFAFPQQRGPSIYYQSGSLPPDADERSDDEERLMWDKLHNYNKLIRPVPSLNDSVHVEFGIAVVQIIR